MFTNQLMNGGVFIVATMTIMSVLFGVTNAPFAVGIVWTGITLAFAEITIRVIGRMKEVESD